MLQTSKISIASFSKSSFLAQTMHTDLPRPKGVRAVTVREVNDSESTVLIKEIIPFLASDEIIWLSIEVLPDAIIYDL